MLKPYEEYKKIDLLWLDIMPSHWQCIRNKNILTEINVRSLDGSEELLRISQYTGVTIRRHNKSKVGMRDAETLEGYKIVKKNDIVMNIMLAWNGSTGASAFDGIVSPAYSVFRVKQDVNPWYIHYLFRIPAVTNYFKAYSTGVIESRLRLYPEKLFMLTSIIPPREEQDQIVRFLDWKLAKINKLIRAKKKQIELLNERIDTMTNNAIKMDGINTQRLCNISSKIGSWISRENDRDYISIGLFNRGRGIFHKPPIKGSDLGDSEFFIVEDNALIFSGQFAWEGAVALTEKADKGCIASHRYYMIRGKEGLVKNEYLWAFFRTKYGDMLLNLYSRGAAGRNRPLNINDLLKEHIPIPPIEVQEKIAQEVKLLQQYVKVVNRFEGFLSEYRTRLISDVVTGKVDVRGIEIPEYEAVPDDVTEDELDGENAMDDEAEEAEVE